MRELEKIVLVGLTKDEVSFIKRLVKKLKKKEVFLIRLLLLKDITLVQY
jgi:hypothetical protein